jgi:hypothetical protein
MPLRPGIAPHVSAIGESFSISAGWRTSCARTDRGTVLALPVSPCWRAASARPDELEPLTMRWKREGSGAGRRRPDTENKPLRDRLRGALERRGLASDFAETLSRRLQLQLVEQDEDTCNAVLDGVATAYAVESQSNESLARSLRELGELEQLMKSFAGELSKLDESLEVLAAYLRRMRGKGASPEPDRVLH